MQPDEEFYVLEGNCVSQLVLEEPPPKKPTGTFKKDFPILLADALTSTDRVYPLEVIKSFVGDLQYKGQVNFPPPFESWCEKSKREEIFSHKVNRLYLDDKMLMAEIETLETCQGYALRHALETNISVVFRPICMEWTGYYGGPYSIHVITAKPEPKDHTEAFTRGAHIVGSQSMLLSVHAVCPFAASTYVPFMD